MSTPAHALAIPTPQMPAPAEWTTLREMAGVFIKSGLLPASIKTPEAALTVMLKARELGIPPLYGLSNIVVVQGKPVCSAELMLALMYRDQGDNAVVVEESTAETCRVSYRRRGWDRSRAFAFTLEDARRAGLAGKGTWAQYPQAMLRARCISAVARMAFPDSIGGLYTPEEMGAPVTVTDDGEVEIIALPPATSTNAVDDEPPAPIPIRQGAPPLPATNPVRVLLEEALDLAWRARGAGLQPTQPTAAATDAQLKKWMDHWAPLLAAAEAKAEEAPAAESEVIEPEDIPDDVWDQMKREPATEPALPLEVAGTGWRSASTPLGRDVSALVDQLEAAGLPIDLPADDAPESAIQTWLGQKRRALAARRAK